VYTVVAEKFEAMVKLGNANTRMKDFHDVWFLTRRFTLDHRTLRQAIEATFARRQTSLAAWPTSLGDALARDPAKQTQWTAFIRRNGLKEMPGEFTEVIVTIRDYLALVLRS